jgi:hypothetical protein
LSQRHGQELVLTYKSHEELIKAKIAELASADPPVLHFFQPAMPGLKVERHLVMSSEVRAAIVEEFPDEEERHAALLDFFQTFAGHKWLTVSENPAEHPPDTMVARNSPVAMELWDFRVYADETRVHPQKRAIRVCGGFACKNTFVALTWDYREVIGEEFDQFVLDTRAAWDQLFYPLSPHKGNSLDDYLTYAHLVD